MIGDGCVIAPRATLERNVILGRNVKVGIGHDPRRRPAGPQVQGRAHDRRDRRRHDDSRVHDDQSRHHAVVQDDGREELLHHVVRASRARLSRRRRRDPREQRAARRARHGGEKAIIAGATAVHQFVQIGQYAFVGGCSRVSKDVPPFVKAVGNPIKLYGLNSVGLQRNDFPEEVVRELKRAYRLFFRSELNVTQAMERAATELEAVSRRCRSCCASSRRAGAESSSERARARSASIGAGGLGLSPRADPARHARVRTSPASTSRAPSAPRRSRASSACARSSRSTRCSTRWTR